MARTERPKAVAGTESCGRHRKTETPKAVDGTESWVLVACNQALRSHRSEVRAGECLDKEFVWEFVWKSQSDCNQPAGGPW